MFPTMALFFIIFMDSKVMLSKLQVVVTKMLISPTNWANVAHWKPPRALKAQVGSYSEIMTRAPASFMAAAQFHITIIADRCTLIANHHISCTHDGVKKRVPAAIDIVELGFRQAIAEIDGWEQKLALGNHLLQAQQK